MPQWIWRHFPSFSCFLVLKPCVQNIFNIFRWYCAKCNFTGDWIRMGLKRNRPKFGSRHCPLGLTWSNHQENHHHQQISLASLQAITKKIIIINKFPWPHFKRSPGESSTKNISAKLLSSSMDQIRSYDTWSKTVMKLGPETKCQERACLKFSPPSPTWDQHLQLPRLKHLPKISGGHHSYLWSQLSSIWSFETWVSRRGLLESRVWSKPTGNICGAWEWEEKKFKKDKYWK